MEENYVVASFYKYSYIENPLGLKEKITEFCNFLDIKGRILLGKEGINGSIYGSEKSIEKCKEFIMSHNSFSDMEFKEQKSEKIAFRRLLVSVREEIVHFGIDVDLKNTGKFITPKELKESLSNNKDIVLLDMRNDYESRIGRFKNARPLSIRNFRDLPKALHEIEDLKGKNVVAYCTGGIRCEKASAFLRENGFNNVSQLKGGILNFGKECPDTYWEGRCFVFDDRISIPINKSKNDTLNKCEWCNADTDIYINCHNIKCDKLFICCEECKFKHNASCCMECSKSSRRRKKATSLN